MDSVKTCIDILQQLGVRIESQDERSLYLEQRFNEVAANNAKLQQSHDTIAYKLQLAEAELKEAKRDQHEFSKVSQVIRLEKENYALRKEIEILNTRIDRLLRRQQGTTPTDLDTNDINNAQDPPTTSTDLDTNDINNAQDPPTTSTDLDTKDINDAQDPPTTSTDLDTKDINDAQDPPTPTTSTNHDLQEQNNDDKQELSVYERKIKGVMYYISDTPDMFVYDILDDGDVGPLKGKCRKVDGKYTIVPI